MLHDFATAKTTFDRVSKMLPGSSDVLEALGFVNRRDGHWDESIAYFEQALSLDPRNTELLSETAWTYAKHRQFPAALKLYDRALDITPNDPYAMAAKAGIYQAQGNLPEAARLLSGINEQTPSEKAFYVKITQLRLERNYGEAVRLLQARLAQFNSASQYSKGVDQVTLALMQRLAGDTAGAKITAEQARNTLEPVFKNQPDSVNLAANFAFLLSQAYAELGEKGSALQVANRAIMLLPRDKDAMDGSEGEENLAIIQTIVGENRHAIPTLTQLLQMSYQDLIYSPSPVTPALLRLDPIWDPLRSDPAFRKLCEEKHDQTTNGH